MILLYVLMAACAVAGATYLDRVSLSRQHEATRTEIQKEAEVIALRFQRELVSKEAMARGLAGSIASNPDLTQEQFQQIARHLATGSPGLLAISAAPDLVVRYVYPLDRNTGELGMHYRKGNSTSLGVWEAMDRGDVTLSGPTSLIQGRQGVTIRMPVNLEAGPRPERFWGMASIVMDSYALFDTTGLFDLADDYRVDFRRFTADGEFGTMVLGTHGVLENNPYSRRIPLASGDWLLNMTPKSGWATAPGNRSVIWAGTAAMLAAAIAILEVLFRMWRERERMRGLLVEGINAIDDGFAIFDADDRLVIFNETYREMYGAGKESIREGARYESLVREGLRSGWYPEAIGHEEDWVARRMEAHATGQTQIVQVQEGNWIQFSESRTANGNTVGLRIDVTEMREAREAAESANRAKTDFLNNVSHELRTPLTIMLGYMAFLAKMDSLPEYRDHLAAIEAGDREQAMQSLDALHEMITRHVGKVGHSGQHLLDLINTLLDWSRIEAGEITLHCEEIAAEQVVEQVASEIGEIAAPKGLTVETRIEPFVLQADPVRLRQILFNLAGNAVKFTEKGGITITCREDLDGSAVFVVEDTGCGIPEADRIAIFQRFKQVDSSATRTQGGTGLGLAITRELVGLHGGEIGVTSAYGGGSRFEVRLPKGFAVSAAA